MSRFIGLRVFYYCSKCGTPFTLSRKSKELPNGDVVCHKCVAQQSAESTTGEKHGN